QENRRERTATAGSAALNPGISIAFGRFGESFSCRDLVMSTFECSEVTQRPKCSISSSISRSCVRALCLVVRGLSCAAKTWACRSVPPFSGQAVIPVARKVGEPIGALMPALFARLPIIRQASAWLIGWLLSIVTCMDLRGVGHAVQVSAQTLYAAVARR